MGTTSIQYTSKDQKKYNAIEAATILFALSSQEKENLANKAGLTLYQDSNFPLYLQTFIVKSQKKHKTIYTDSLLSERMYRHIKSGRYLTKISLLALTISLGCTIDEIHTVLQKAGYVLSESIAFDMVVLWLLQNTGGKKEKELLLCINDVLYELELPLLMTRDKS